MTRVFNFGGSVKRVENSIFLKTLPLPTSLRQVSNACVDCNADSSSKWFYNFCKQKVVFYVHNVLYRYVSFMRGGFHGKYMAILQGVTLKTFQCMLEQVYIQSSKLNLLSVPSVQQLTQRLSN